MLLTPVFRSVRSRRTRNTCATWAKLSVLSSVVSTSIWRRSIRPWPFCGSSEKRPAASSHGMLASASKVSEQFPLTVRR